VENVEIAAAKGRIVMDFGVFDHLDCNGADLCTQYAQRLELATLYDQLGFYAYHLAEHHSTPLGMSPSPSVFLSSIIQRTQRLRIGPLVYLLPLYHPLRLLEEICMLDNLSNGRMQLGVGRGISPIELAYYGRTPDEAKEVYEENLRILLAGFAAKTLNHAGRYSRFDKVPMSLRPTQRPHPPIWMGISSEGSAAFAGKSGYNIVALMRGAAMRSRVEAYREARGTEEWGKVGISFLVVVGDDDGSAISIASSAYTAWHHSFHYLYRLHGRQPELGTWPETFGELMKAERAIAGSPQTVIDFLRHQVDASGINYIVSQLMFGNLPHEMAKRSIELYAREVIPKVRA
jgi:alkanesulfonate monooxygenase SsuD/methylene tetrahydromethanopterin reductase-like flavin-dependent oxidoreductase (luciferase family)